MKTIQKIAKTTLIFGLILGTLIHCKKEDKEEIDPITLLLLGLTANSYNCSANVGGRVSGLPAMTATTSVQTLVYGKVPFVNHSIAAVKFSNVKAGDQISFTGRNVADFDEGTANNVNAPLVYNTASCPLLDSAYDSARTSYTTPSEGQYGSAAGNGPYVYTLNATKGGDYYFVFYLASRTAEPPTTTFQITLKN
ncbi:hypothetical protein JWG45_03280 [Leptospira sp. 201903070]|uniref:Lipoprotein n=1 Tax=Leptospira ainlahdjerensis TaxID=2810033 RepID=A0ABS2UAB0_9LEPT|nr:hypothetical protein [Leptospira ainlahdjerensis]MBM9576167.1 hypothetical protein [Leptospira ainlahdjerensis]